MIGALLTGLVAGIVGRLLVPDMKMAAVFMIVASTIGVRLGVFPRWLVVTGYLAALALILNVSYTETLILAFPAWVAAVSVVVLRASPTRTRAREPLVRPGS